MTLGTHSNIASTGSNISAQVSVGSYTSVGPYVSMQTLHQHACIQDRNLVSTFQLPLKGYPQPYGAEKIVIGSDVWIGRNAVLLGDITIGDGAIIGAHAVVAKDIPPFAVVVGNPVVIKRYRFTPDQIEKMLKIKWWNWPEEKIKEFAEDFWDINRFIKNHENDVY